MTELPAVTNRSARRAGVLRLASGAVLISFAAVFVRLASVGPTTAGFYRMLIGGVALAVVAAARRERPRPDRRAVVLAIVAGAVFAVDLIAWHRSIHYVGPGLATILANFQVFILAGIGTLTLGERMGWRMLVAIPLAVAGLFLLVGVDWASLSPTYRAGVLLGLGAAVAYGTLLLVLRASQRRAGRMGVASSLTVVCLTAAALLGPAALLEGQGLGVPDLATAGVLAAYALTAQVAGWMLITRGLPDVEAGTAGLLILLQPTLAFVWDILFFARPTDLPDVAGAVLALCAIYLGTARRY